jgi:hypothetical protein
MARERDLMPDPIVARDLTGRAPSVSTAVGTGIRLRCLDPGLGMSDRTRRWSTMRPNRFEAQMEGFRQVAELLRRQLADVREDHDRWRTQAESVTHQLTNHRRPWWRH